MFSAGQSVLALCLLAGRALGAETELKLTYFSVTPSGAKVRHTE